jgi:DNA-binding MarR family transcriptional regulator
MRAVLDSTVEPVAVANRLRPVLLQLNRHLRREVHPLGVTGGQVSLLVAIKRAAGIGVRELAAQEGISPAGMSGHVDRLENAGLVARRPDSGGDRRRVGLHVTPEGERVLRLVKSRRTAWLAARLRRLDAEQLAKLDEAIEPLAALLEEDV